MNFTPRFRFAPLALGLSVALASCGGTADSEQASAQGIAVSVKPDAVQLFARGSAAFSAAATGSAVTSVTWTIQEGAAGGTISASGAYTAPAASGTYHIIVRSVADTNQSATATATVTQITPQTGWAATCAAEPIRTTGTKYYACDCQPGSAAGCVAGSDANAGTSPSAALRTISALAGKFRSMNAGDTVALCKGGVFDGSVTQGWDNWGNAKCSGTGASSCMIRDYAAPWNLGSESRPTLSVTGPNSVMLFANRGGVRILNINFLNTSAGGAGLTTGNYPAIWVGTNSTDVEVCNCILDGFTIGIYTNGCGARRFLRGSIIRNSCLDGALVEDNDSWYDGNTFVHNGTDACFNYSHLQNPAGGTAHAWYLTTRCGSSNVRFVNNSVTDTALYNGACSGTSPVVMGGVSSNVTIENNYVEGGADGTTGNCGGIYGGNSYGDVTGTHANLVVRRNRVVNVHQNAIGFASVSNPIIEDNVIVYMASSPGVTNAIAIPHWTNKSPGETPSYGGTIRNNTIYVTNASGGTGIAVGTAGNTTTPGFNVTGNAIYATTGSLSNCFAVGSLSNIAMMNNNLCYGATNWATTGTNYSLASWRTASGLDLNSLNVTPQFVNAPSDFAPAAGSPLIGAASTLTTCAVGGVAGQPCSSPVAVGTSTWSATDTAKARAAPPDIGAYQR
jgi:hypothetical protein